METTIRRNWLATALRGAIALTFGVVALALPEPTLAVLIAVAGAFLLADGLLSGLTAIYFGEWRILSLPPTIEAIVAIGMGLITLFWPDVTAFALLYLLAAWAILTGLIQLIAAYQLRHYLRGEWLLALRGLVPLSFGALLAIFPQEGALALVRLIGLGAALLGLYLLILAYRLHRRQGRLTLA